MTEFGPHAFRLGLPDVSPASFYEKCKMVKRTVQSARWEDAAGGTTEFGPPLLLLSLPDASPAELYDKW